MQCSPGQVVVSKEAWGLIKKQAGGSTLSSKDVLIQKLKVQLKPQSLKRSRAQDPTVLTLLRRYIPAVVVPHLSLQGAAWAAELRTITVVFLNLGIQGIDRMPDPEEVDKLQAVLARVQAAIYRHEGSLNKFLVDDKGATLLAVFGLAPLAHENDPERAVLAAMDIKESMRSVGVTAWIGITSGTAFCGPIGSKTRQEYSVLGDVVNTSARLMQAAKAKSSTSGSSVGGGGANNSEGRVLVDKATMVCIPRVLALEARYQSLFCLQESASARPVLQFTELEPLKLKGKTVPTRVFEATEIQDVDSILSVLWKPRTEPLLAAFAGYDTFLFNKVSGSLCKSCGEGSK